jgi:hypothetical protein
MKRLVVTLLVLVGLAAAFDRHAAKERLHEYRVVNQNLHLDMLEKEIEELEEEFEHLTELPTEEEIESLKARVRNLEDDGCDELDGDVQCGGDVPQCINHLFVCDGHEDCHNGHDEDDYICSDEPYRVGTSIAGITTWHDCIVHEPHNTIITITANFQPEAYTSRTYVRAVVSFEIDEDSHLVESFNAKGYWNPAKQALVLVPDDNEDRVTGYAVVCIDNLGSHHEASCKIQTLASRHECATFRAVEV